MIPRPVLLDINPAVGLSSHWWFLVAGLALLGVACLVALVVMSRRRAEQFAPRDDVAALRSNCLAHLDALETELGAGASPQTVCRRASLAVRRFIGIVSGRDADFQTASALEQESRRDPRLRPAAAFAVAARDAAFSGNPDVEGAHRVLESGREVVTSWH